MAKYFVSTAGDDSNDGLTWDTAWGTISGNQASLSSGDTVIVGAGTYNVGISQSNIFTISGVTYYSDTPGGAILTAHATGAGFTWAVLEGGSVYQATLSNTVGWINAQRALGVWDESTNDWILSDSSDGSFVTGTAPGLNPGEALWDPEGSTLSIRTADDREPDSSIKIFNTNIIRWDGAKGNAFDGFVFEYGLKAAGEESELGDSAASGNWLWLNNSMRKLKNNALNPTAGDSWMVRGCYFRNIGIADTDYAIYTRSNLAGSLTVERCVLEQITGYGLHIFGSGSPSGGHMIRKNVFLGSKRLHVTQSSPTAHAVIQVADDGKHNYFEDNYVYHVPDTIGGIPNPEVSGIVVRTNNTFVRRNYFHLGRFAFWLDAPLADTVVTDNNFLDAVASIDALGMSGVLDVSRNKWKWDQYDETALVWYFHIENFNQNTGPTAQDSCREFLAGSLATVLEDNMPDADFQLVGRPEALKRVIGNNFRHAYLFDRKQITNCIVGFDPANKQQYSRSPGRAEKRPPSAPLPAKPIFKGVAKKKPKRVFRGK